MNDTGSDYDEFSMLKQYADHEGIPWSGQPDVMRKSVELPSGQRISLLAWGNGDPEIVLLHGGGQNAHTWDSAAMAFQAPLVAIDLPGHGHSDWREDHDYGAWTNAGAAAVVIERVARNAKAVVGMSLGGNTTFRLAARYPDLVRRAVIVDITPTSRDRRSTLTKEQRGATVLRDGPAVFASFEEILRAAAAAVPGRPIESLRAGVLHNSMQLGDGSWAWRYDPQRVVGAPADRNLLWEDVSSIRVPLMLVRGGQSAMVQDDDLGEFTRRQPDARVEMVEGAGHSIQSDQPIELVRLVKDFVEST